MPLFLRARRDLSEKLSWVGGGLASLRLGDLAFLLLSGCAGELSVVFDRNVDILDLHRAGPIVKMQVLRYGRPVVINDEVEFQRFAMYTPSEFFDFKLRRAPIEEAIKAAVLS